MKRFFILFTAAVMMAGCGPSGKVIVKKDEFKDVTTVTMENYYNPDEWSGVGRTMNVSFYREIKEGKKGPVVIDFLIRADDSVSELSPKVFIKANNKYELKITSILIESKSQTKVNNEVEVRKNSGSSSFVDYTNSGVGSSSSYTAKSSSTSQTTRWKEVKGNFTLSPEAENDILSSSEILIRFYSGNKPITYKIEKSELQKIKDYLKNDGSIQK